MSSLGSQVQEKNEFTDVIPVHKEDEGNGASFRGSLEAWEWLTRPRQPYGWTFINILICLSFMIQSFIPIVQGDLGSTMADNKAKSTKPANKTPPRSPSDPTKDRAAKRLSCDSNSSHEGAMAGEISALEEAFRKFAIHGDTRATGKEMHGKNWSKLCKDCQVIDGKNVTITDVDIVFSKIKGKSSRTITFEQFKEALQELSKKRFKEKSDEEAIQEIYKLIEGKAPIISGVTKAISSPTVSRLTDTSKFTGSHKERFDPSGKGKGRAGREDLVDASGYVSGYKHAGTYDHKVQGSNDPLNPYISRKAKQ